MKGNPWRHINLVRVLTISLILIMMCASASAITCSELQKYINCDPGKKADIVVVFDTTRSMHGNLCKMKNVTMDFINDLNSSGIDYRLGLTEFDDFTGVCGGRCGGIIPLCGDVPYRIYNDGNLVGDPNTFNSWIQDLRLHCGGDPPESILAALNHTISDQKWRGNDVKKIAILISDSIPHHDGDCCNGEGDTLPEVQAALISNGVTLYIIGEDSGYGQILPGWATNLATNTGGKFYDICKTRSLLPVLEDIISYIRCSFNLTVDTMKMPHQLNICVKLIGKNGTVVPYDPVNTSAWVVINCPGCVNNTIKFVGTLIKFTQPSGIAGAPAYWTVKVNKVICGPMPCSDTIKVVTYQAIPVQWGTVDANLKPGDSVWVFGNYVTDISGCQVTLGGSRQYYLQRQPNLVRYDLTYDPSKEAFCGTINSSCIDENGNANYTIFARICEYYQHIPPPPNMTTVKIDIKPGLCPNYLNLLVNDNIPIAIVGTDEFDVTTVDPSSIRLGYGADLISPVKYYYADESTPFNGTLCNCTDRGADGRMDLIVEFSIPEILASLNLPYKPDSAVILPLTISGFLYQEYGLVAIGGQDCVQIPCTRIYGNDTSDNSTPVEAAKAVSGGCHACEMIMDNLESNDAVAGTAEARLHTDGEANSSAIIKEPPTNDANVADLGNETAAKVTKMDETSFNETAANESIVDDTIHNTATANVSANETLINGIATNDITTNETATNETATISVSANDIAINGTVANSTADNGNEGNGTAKNEPQTNKTSPLEWVKQKFEQNAIHL